MGRKGIIHGAVTNGCEWIFIIFHLNDNGIGGSYWLSPPVKIDVSEEYLFEVLSPGSDVVASLVTYWVCYFLFSFMCPHEQIMPDREEL